MQPWITSRINAIPLSLAFVQGPGEKDSVKSKGFRVRKGIPIMASENESFNLEDLPIFLNSVLERAEFICHEKVIDLSNVETH